MAMTILKGLRVVEFESLGPCPFCGMLLADLGADVILIERPDAADGPHTIYRRGKRSIRLDLKQEVSRRAAAAIVRGADALIEGMRPGVMERLGLGPEALRADNPALVYGRVTGWGQSGPLAPAAGHDVNYAGLSGAAWYAGAAGDAPVPPPTLVGDVGGGALYLAIGVLAGVLAARRTGRGGVVDAAIVDGSAHMLNLLLSLRGAGEMSDARGTSLLDGAPFYGVYACADGQWISIGALESKFYAELRDRLGLAEDPLFAAQVDKAAWPAGRARLAALFASQPRGYWEDRLRGTDACVAPVLSPGEAARDPHMAARMVFRTVGGVLQTAAAPRFEAAPPADPEAPPKAGAHAREILEEAGVDARDIEALL